MRVEHQKSKLGGRIERISALTLNFLYVPALERFSVKRLITIHPLLHSRKLEGNKEMSKRGCSRPLRITYRSPCQTAPGVFRRRGDHPTNSKTPTWKRDGRPCITDPGNSGAIGGWGECAQFDLAIHLRMKPKPQRPFLFLASLLIQALSSSANTEIINLTPTISPRISALDSISSDWPVLTPVGGQNERRWSMIHTPQDAEACIEKREWCEDDLWLVLDFDAEEWSAYRSFTLRLSWPASVCPGSSNLLLGFNLCFRPQKLILTLWFLNLAPV